MMTLGSLFDGIGGFPLAAMHNGIIPVWASEIERFPIEVTKTRFPDMVHMGDITKLDGAKLPPVDVICGGSPCQDLSVAGNRRGMAGERSGLFMEQVRIVKEMREADRGRGIPDYLVRPRYLVWENVPGAFSSAGGRDFQMVLEEIIHIKEGSCHVPRPDTGRWEPAGAAILGDGFSLAWRVLDAQYWGVPQRRRRIYLVADFRGLSAPEILFKQDSLSGNPAAGAGEGEGSAATAQGGAYGPGGQCLTSWDVQSRRVFEEDGIWPALYGGEGGGHGYIRTGQKTTGPMPCQDNQADRRMDITHGMIADQWGGMGSQSLTVQIEESDRKKEHTLMIGSFHVNQRNEVIDLHGLSGALLATRNMQMQTFVTEVPRASGMVIKNEGEDGAQSSGCNASSNNRHGKMGQENPIRVAAFCGDSGVSAGGIGYQEECSPTLNTGTAPSVLCLNDQGGSQMHLTENQAGTLRAQEHGHQPLVFDNHAQDSRLTTINHAEYQAINNQYVSQDKCVVGKRNLIRRLTPLECERLQGFPDGWTDIPGASDSARYKALGNSVAIPCVDFVLRGIAYFLGEGCVK